MAYEDQLHREALEYRAKKSRRLRDREETGRLLLRGAPGTAYDPRQQANFVDSTEEVFSVTRP